MIDFPILCTFCIKDSPFYKFSFSTKNNNFLHFSCLFFYQFILMTKIYFAEKDKKSIPFYNFFTVFSFFFCFSGWIKFPFVFPNFFFLIFILIFFKEEKLKTVFRYFSYFILCWRSLEGWKIKLHNFSEFFFSAHLFFYVWTWEMEEKKSRVWGLRGRRKVERVEFN